MRIESSDGISAASYCCDARGKILWSSGELAALNSLRYRGYVYDQETGFYYLNSQYYDPAVGRFINPDSLLNQESALGNNMFAYTNAHLTGPLQQAVDSGLIQIFPLK